MLTLQNRQLHLMGDSNLQTYSHRLPRDDIPYQYAIPANQDPAEQNGRKTIGLTYVQHELLRQRKTPGGKLLEHDNSPLDKNVYQPASKHLLLSSSPDGRTSRYNYGLNQNTTERYGDYLHSIPNQFHGVKNHMATSSWSDNCNQRPAWDFPGGIDSVLNQTLPFQQSQRYYLHPGSNIPTVLPTALNSQFGPTASARQQRYGPYWPDGTFNPYRPASIRDSRFFIRDHDNYGTTYQHNFPALRRPGKLPITYQNNALPHVNMYESYTPQYPIEKSLWLPECQLYPSFASNHQIEHPNSLLYSADESANPYLSLKSKLKPSVDSEQIAFRDKTFAWANRIYSDLLASMQNGSNDHRSSFPQNFGIRSTSQPSIFPQPPKRTGSHFTERLNQATTIRNVNSQDNSLKNSQDIISRPGTAIYAPSRRASENASDFRHNTNIKAQVFTSPTSKRDGRRTSDSRLYTLPQNQSEAMLYESASSALSTIELLCNEAKTPWVDGLLLAGCLAYGTGDYGKALTLYQAILVQDPSHVEATSNLAATLHALNRNDEALSYWSAAVRLRPSYFEAVEHLIGLLCSSHRAKEAINIIEYVQSSLILRKPESNNSHAETLSDTESDSKSHTSSIASMPSAEQPHYDFDGETGLNLDTSSNEQNAPGFGSSGYAIPGFDNGRLLALIHAKGNMLYGLGNHKAAAAAFEDAILIATGERKHGIRGVITNILIACLRNTTDPYQLQNRLQSKDPVLLAPDQAELTSRNMFPPSGDLPGLEFVSRGMSQKAGLSTTSNALLSLAKIYQDSIANGTEVGSLKGICTRDILALYYLSLSFQRSPSTANNVGILLAGVHQNMQNLKAMSTLNNQVSHIPGVVPGSGIALALAYYNYGLNLDPKHAHLYTNLGSLLKDINQLAAAIKMYEMAVNCDGSFDIALANLANAVKDQGRIADAITYYRRAVQANPNFAEAVCGLATALNSVCNWYGRGGVYADGGCRDRIHVNERGLMHEAGRPYGWMNRVVEIVEKQLKKGEVWGCGTLNPVVIDELTHQLNAHKMRSQLSCDSDDSVRLSLQHWAGRKWEGSRIVRLIERATRHIGWQWYQDRYRYGKEYPTTRYIRPRLPKSLSTPSAPTVLPFHTFTAPLSAKQVRQISQRNALRISVSTLRSSWLPSTVFQPPPPPNPCLNVGYVSSDFNNHPLAHLMQSVFGFHDQSRVRSFCYATTSADGSPHRQQIEREAPVFHDVSNWNLERLVNQIVNDKIHVLVNLNGYTRGARNEVFAARPAPIQMSFMGFAGTLGAEWCDYVLADSISVPGETLSPWRRNVDIIDRLRPDSLIEDAEDWVYSENIIFTRASFFCVDHKQSAPDASQRPALTHSATERETAWKNEQDRRWKLRKEIFPTLSDSAIVLGNFNQLYKIDPTTFRMYLRILAAIPNSILWLLRFPDLGEQNLRTFAKEWAGPEVASRVVFTDVASKGAHITRASVVDLFLDTPECNAHTTAADVIWSGTPILTWGKWKYKMCSRMAGSIVASALPEGREGDEARRDLLVPSEEKYEEHAIRLGRGLVYSSSCSSSSGTQTFGQGKGRLMDLRRMLWEGRWTSRLFDTKRWVRDLENAYWQAWRKWENGEGGDIWL